MTTVLEFDVEMTCGSCEKAVRGALDGNPNLVIKRLSHEENKLVVQTTLPSFKVQELVELTGRKAVFKGAGSAASMMTGAGDAPDIAATTKRHLGAAVAMMYPDLYFGPVDRNVQGVARFIQIDDGTCVIEGTIDGLTPGPHGLHVHECGDLSDGCGSTGAHFNPTGTSHGAPTDPDRHVGDLGNVTADDDGRASFRIVDNVLKVWDVVGRSLVIKESADDLGRGGDPVSKRDGGAGRGIACGIIARSAGLFDNPKKICACDGKTIWDERKKAVEGRGKAF